MNQKNEFLKNKKMDSIYLRDESYKIIGLCMEVYNFLGKGHNEIVYKDALEYEFKINSIPFEREKIYEIEYKEIDLSLLLISINAYIY